MTAVINLSTLSSNTMNSHKPVSQTSYRLLMAKGMWTPEYVGFSTEFA